MSPRPPTGPEVEGIDRGPVSEWLAANVDGAVPPFDFELIAGGRSNLTYRVTDAAGHAYALRRPPVSHVLPTAHDMAREHTVISALQPTDVPVPRTLGLCTDPAVNGAPFYVMSFVDGHILRDEASAAGVRGGAGPRQRLAGRHPGRPPRGRRRRRRPRRTSPAATAYIARQLKRWHGQFDQSTLDGKPGPAIIDRCTGCSRPRIPEQQGVAIVHGDYRLDNTVLDDAGNVLAILDWEICTLGDPLADLGLLLVYWAEAGDPIQALLGVAPTALPGFATRAQLLDRYAAASGLDVSSVPYYCAFGIWKLACILQGVYARYAGGAAAGDRSGVDQFADHVGQPRRAGPRRGGGAVSRHGPSTLYEIDPGWGRPAGTRLDRPVLVVALEGWVDAGMGASAAIAHLLTDLPHRRRRHLRHRAAHRPAGPPSDRPARGRGHHRTDLADHPAAGRQGPGRAPTSST